VGKKVYENSEVRDTKKTKLELLEMKNKIHEVKNSTMEKEKSGACIQHTASFCPAQHRVLMGTSIR